MIVRNKSQEKYSKMYIELKKNFSHKDVIQISNYISKIIPVTAKIF